VMPFYTAVTVESQSPCTRRKPFTGLVSSGMRNEIVHGLRHGVVQVFFMNDCTNVLVGAGKLGRSKLGLGKVGLGKVGSGKVGR